MTNNKQQTAVEWFLIECGKYGDTAQIPDEVIEQAKKMEKQQRSIELPSDEEIYINANVNSENTEQHIGFIKGMQTIRELIEKNKL